MQTTMKSASRMHTALALTALTVVTAGSAHAVGQYSLYRSDQQRTGRSQFTATYRPTDVWSFSTNVTSSTSPIVGNGGYVYFVSSDKYLYSITPAGTLNWRKRLGDAGSAGVAIDRNGNIYAATAAGRLYASTPTGGDLWPNFISAGGGIAGAPLITSDGSIYIGGQDKWVYALNANGSIKWRYQTGGAISQSLAASPDGATLYASCDDGRVYAINNDGTLKWTSNAISPSSNCAVGNDGTIYTGCTDGRFMALDPTAGSVSWEYKTSGRITSAPAIAADGTIYFGNQDSQLYALTSNGTLKWTQRSYASIYSAPTIDRLGTILYGSWDGKLVAVNPVNGSTLWSKSLTDKLYTSPAVGTNGNVYIIDSHGTLFGVSGPFVADVPEPSSLLALITGAALLVGTKRIRKQP